jgi:hypothetical protein
MEKEDDRISFIEVENIGCLKKATVNFGPRKPGEGRLCTLLGANATGKTSFLNGVRAMFQGGHDPALIRTGAEKAVIRMGTVAGVEYTRTITQSGYYLRGTGADGLKFDPPEAQMKRMASGFGFDPVAFDQAGASAQGKKKQLEFFLKYLPMTFRASEIAQATRATHGIAPSENDLDIAGLNKLLAELSDKRAAIGAKQKEKANSAETFRVTLLKSDSGDEPKDWAHAIACIHLRQAELERSEHTATGQISLALRQTLEDTDKAIRSEESLLSAHYQALLAIARTCGSFDGYDESFLNQKFIAIRELYVRRTTATAEATSATVKIREDNHLTREQIAGELATAQAANDAQQRTAGIRESMASLQKEAQALSAQRDTVDRAVKALEALKQSKLKDLPVQDVEIAEGELYLDGRPWGNANQARRWLKSIEVGCLALGTSGFLLVDEAEGLDHINWEDFERAVVDFGIDVLAARVASTEEIDRHGRQLRSVPAAALVMG